MPVQNVPKVIPNNTVVALLNLLMRDNDKTKMMPNKAKIKAIPDVKYGFVMTRFPPLKAITPPPMMIIATFAPKTAALETPNVDGEAITLLLIVCMMTPDIDKATPMRTAAMILGKRIF